MIARGKNGEPEAAADRAGFGRGDAVSIESHRDLQALQAIAEDDCITQRTLAHKLGIALGLTNIYLKRLVRKGYVKCVNVKSNRLRYLLTPTGLTEKTRLTYEFMEYSLYLYSQVRLQLRAVLKPFSLQQQRRVAVFGTGEAAELAYLSITELGLDLVSVFDRHGTGHFLGQAVRSIETHRQVVFDVMLVATLERSEEIVEQLIALGIEPERLATLRPVIARDQE